MQALNCRGRAEVPPTAVHTFLYTRARTAVHVSLSLFLSCFPSSCFFFSLELPFFSLTSGATLGKTDEWLHCFVFLLFYLREYSSYTCGYCQPMPFSFFVTLLFFFPPSLVLGNSSQTKRVAHVERMRGGFRRNNGACHCCVHC